MKHFDHLCTVSWTPQFKWVATLEEVADLINRPHEDYPKYVDSTLRLLQVGIGGDPIAAPDLRLFHLAIFTDKPFRGRFRNLNVRVGDHIAPDWERVEALMDELWSMYVNTIDTTERLVEWYTDFNTIHPFQDGNGRVSGVVTAIISHQLHHDLGWLGPLQ